MFRKISLIAILVCSHNAFAFDFNNYTPTLDRLYVEGLSPINSGYYLFIDAGGLNLAKNPTRNGVDLDKIMAKYLSWEDSNNDVIGYFYSNETPAIENSGAGSSISVDGGIIGSNKSISGAIIGDFVCNYIENSTTYVGGAAIYNKSLEHVMYDKEQVLSRSSGIKGDFIENHVSVSKYNSKYGYGTVAGGAIYNAGIIGPISGNFIYNYVSSVVDTLYSGASGGAIYSVGEIGHIVGDFIDNYAFSKYGEAGGGAVYISNHGYYDNGQVPIDGKLSGNFINNYAYSDSKNAYGGAIYTNGSLNISASNGDYIFSGNYAYGETAYGGAIYSLGDLTLSAYNANYIFSGNYAYGKYAYGGAIYSEGDITISANNANYVFSGNYVANKDFSYKRYFAISTNSSNTKLKIKTYNGGTVSFDDEISLMGGNNTIEISGDNTGMVILRNLTSADDIVITNSYLKLERGPYSYGDVSNGANFQMKKATLDIADNRIETMTLNSLSGNGYIYLDLDPEKNMADNVVIQGKWTGTFDIIVNVLSDLNIQGKEPIMFASGAGGNFRLYRVYGSPFMFDVINTGQNWYLSMNSTINPDYDKKPDPNPDNPEPDNPDPNPDTPDPDKPGSNPDNPEPDKPDQDNTTNSTVQKIKVYPEVVAFTALPSALLNQTRTVADNIAYTHKTGLWIQPVVASATNKSIVDTKSNVKGAEFGITRNGYNNWSVGIFGSVLDGTHDITGDGNAIYSDVSSTIDTTSILFGGYLKHKPKKGINFLTSVYGGKLDSEINTSDGVKSDNSATQLSVKSVLGYDFNNIRSFVLGAQIGGGFTRLSIDDSNDNFGKTAIFDTLNHMYTDFGLNMRLMFRYINFYVKPSYMLTFNNGNELHINNLDAIKSIKNANLIKIDSGINLKLTSNFYANIAANYITGADYSNISISAGMSYKF